MYSDLVFSSAGFSNNLKEARPRSNSDRRSKAHKVRRSKEVLAPRSARVAPQRQGTEAVQSICAKKRRMSPGSANYKNHPERLRQDAPDCRPCAKK